MFTMILVEFEHNLDILIGCMNLQVLYYFDMGYKYLIALLSPLISFYIVYIICHVISQLSSYVNLMCKFISNFIFKII